MVKENLLKMQSDLESATNKILPNEGYWDEHPSIHCGGTWIEINGHAWVEGEKTLLSDTLELIVPLGFYFFDLILNQTN